ncbi:hypothetical protein Esti_000550 [Eimeria stiedai]
MGNHKAGGASDLARGAVLQCLEAATLGMPFEVWKTRMGRQVRESTLEAFRSVVRSKGLSGFWQGTSAKLVESASKGALSVSTLALLLLLLLQEAILRGCSSMGVPSKWGGFLAGAGGGACQTVVMGPCTFAVTALVNGEKGLRLGDTLKHAFKSQGVRGLYPGGSAIALRQMTNWASRQGFTEVARDKLLNRKRQRMQQQQLQQLQQQPQILKLSVGEELLSGCVGGALSTWNQPLEVARIQMQSAAVDGLPRRNIIYVGLRLLSVSWAAAVSSLLQFLRASSLLQSPCLV